MRQFRKATIKEVAAQAGVSTTTVSLFVGGRENVCSPETAERIRQAVTLLNYTPSSLTRGLRQRTSSTIGVCLQNPLDSDVQYGNSFFENLWRGIMNEADSVDYSILHYPASVREGTSTDAFLDGRVDGVLMLAHDNLRPARLASAGMPTVLLTRSLNVPDGCGFVYADEAQTVDLALSHLWELGHRRIAHIAGPLGKHAPKELILSTKPMEWNDDVALQRFFGYQAWMQEHTAFDPALIGYPQNWSAQSAEAMLLSWRALELSPTAVFCANDMQALDLIAAANKMGLRIPEDLSVVSVDNSPQGRDSEPALTSVQVQVTEIGCEAIRALLRLMNGDALKHCRTALPVTDFMVRSSTMARK